MASAVLLLAGMWGFLGMHVVTLLQLPAARLDDVANLIPARLTGGLFVLAAPAAGGSAGSALAALRRDNGRTASPNAGWPMAAIAGALGVTLEKVDHYRLNATGREPGADDVRRAIELTRGALSLGLPLLVALISRPAATSLWRGAKRPGWPRRPGRPGRPRREGG